jgi:hypothetical protein
LVQAELLKQLMGRESLALAAVLDNELPLMRSLRD